VRLRIRPDPSKSVVGEFGTAGFPPKTLFTPAMYTSLHIAALSDRERAFLFYVDGKKFVDKKAFPWAPGAAFKILPLNDVNRDWLTKAADGGFAVDCGPSGTTDELLQAADYTGVTMDMYGACLMRDAAFANMLLQEHHSYAEVSQGAASRDRFTPKWSWDHPYTALSECATHADPALNGVPAALAAIATPFPAPSSITRRSHATGTLPPTASANRFTQALAVYSQLKDGSKLAKAVIASDFGSQSLINHSPMQATSGQRTLIDQYVCGTSKTVVDAWKANILAKQFLCTKP